MAVTIGSNVAALQAQRNLAGATSSLTQVYQRLSSGLRINRASDDAAGLAIASELNVNARIYGQAVRNANDGISAMSIAEGALKELSSIAIRIMELAEQSANGAYSSIQRRANDLEAQKLRDEYSRISQTTSFNNQLLINSANGTISLQVGNSSQATAQIDVQFAAPVVVGIGNGTLAAPVNLTGAANTGAFELGDINGDGATDILYFGSGGTIGSFLANGDGTFKAQTGFTTGYTHGGNEPIKLVDMNNDGKLDVVSASLSSVVITLGNGDGTFKSGISYAATADSNGILVDDFNNDGASDVAIMAPDVTGTLQVFLNNGSGGLSAGTLYPNGLGGRQLASGDINNDGIIDLYSTFSGQIYFGNGNGTFKLGATVDLTVARSLSLVDLNNDGNLDLVAGDTGTTWGVRLGNGNGTFKSQSNYQASAMGADLLAGTYGDFNSDGYVDIAVAASTDSRISVLLNNGDGTFKAQTSYASTGATHNIGVGDLNGDGVTDIITSDYGTSTVQIFMTNATPGGGLPTITLRTAAGARTALTKMRSAVQSIALGLGKLGAYQSRVDSAISNLQVVRENTMSAASQITDGDMAEESARLARLKILQQAGASILAQANKAPALALTLLSSSRG